jgi:hypothetical protein
MLPRKIIVRKATLQTTNNLKKYINSFVNVLEAYRLQEIIYHNSDIV